MDLVLEITDSTGTSILSSADLGATGIRERIRYNFTSTGNYRIRVKSYYTSGTFGGSFRVHIGNTPSSISGGGSCNYFTAAGGSSCYDFATGSTYISTFCTGGGGSYSAANTCATVNAAATPTISGRCLHTSNSNLTNGQGVAVRNYYSAGTGIVTPVNTVAGSGDCSAGTLDSSSYTIFQ
jgi:hypothetical protein